MSIGLALIGAGHWGRNLLRVFRTIPGVELRLVVDCDPDARARCGTGVDALPDAAAVWESRAIDAVVIATPPSSHHALARRALRASKHCWVEKPLALGLAEATELVELAEQSRRVLFVDHTFLYDPLVHHAGEWIRSGRLGDLYHFSFERLGLGRIRSDSDVWWNSGPHDLSILRHLAPREVLSVQAARFSHVQEGIADVCLAILRLQGGVTAQIHLSWLSPQRTARAVAIGSRGMLRYEGRFEQRSLSFYEYTLGRAGPGSSLLPVSSFSAVETIAGDGEEPLARAAEAFIESVRSGKPPLTDGRSALEVVKLLAAADGSV